MTTEPSAELAARLREVRLLLCDVDGVLTDATVLIGDGTTEMKTFNIQDGLGMVNLRENGVQVGWVSSRLSTATASRAKELSIDFLQYSKSGKTAAVEEILAKTRLGWAQVCYAGDDLVDLGPMKRAGAAVAAANAVEEVKAAAHYVTIARGGYGAVREICELILKAQGKWGKVLAKYTG